MKHGGNVVKAKDEIIDLKVKNLAGDDLGKICEIMLDKATGQVAYAVLDSGSFLGIGGKLFALPWSSIHYDNNKECFVLDVDKEQFKTAPGFDKGHWPDMTNRSWGESIAQYYGVKSYWE